MQGARQLKTDEFKAVQSRAILLGVVVMKLTIDRITRETLLRRIDSNKGDFGWLQGFRSALRMLDEGGVFAAEIEYLEEYIDACVVSYRG